MKLSENTKNKLGELGVGVIYLFGSRSIGVALDKSDFDIGIVFVDAKLPDISSSVHFLVYDILSDEFPDMLNGPCLDMSFLQKASPALEMAAIQYGKVLFEHSPSFRTNYEESVTHRYDDYLPLKSEYEQATFYAFKG